MWAKFFYPSILATVFVSACIVICNAGQTTGNADELSTTLEPQVKTTKDCDCGPLSVGCHIFFGEKWCSCKFRTAQTEDDTCQDCACGLDSIGCKFENGLKECDCTSHHVEYNGTCEECDCGPTGFCSYEFGKKTCNCQKGDAEYQGKCKYCYCGEFTEDCQFTDTGDMKCTCADGYVKKGYYCDRE